MGIGLSVFTFAVFVVALIIILRKIERLFFWTE